MSKLVKVSLIAAAVASAFPLSAMADVTVYGRANVSIDYLDDGADYGEANISSNSSRLGFKAEKKTESGITGFMQIEGEITYNQGNSLLSSRDTFVGIKGNFGSVRVGKFDTPFKAARGPANLFGDQLGDMRNLTRVGDARFDERTENTLHYQSPTFSGFNVNLAYSLHEGTAATTGEKDQAISTSVTYKGGPIEAAIAYEQYSEDANRGERNAVRAAMSYKVIDPLKLVALVQTVEHDTNSALNADVFGLGAEYAITKKTAVKGMYIARMAEEENFDADMLTVGVEHKLDSALRVYANYSMVMNDDNVALNPWSQARTTNAQATLGEDASGLSLGLRFDF